MKHLAIGIIIGFLLAMTLAATYSTFSTVQGRGTYASGYFIIPTCPTETGQMEFGAMCKNLSNGEVLIRTGNAGLIAVSGQSR